MQDGDFLMARLFEAISLLITIVSLVMFSFAAFVVFVKGQPSTERSLIGIGALLQALSIVLSLGVRLASNIGPIQIVFRFYSVSHLISFTGAALALYGAVKLLTRAAQMR